MKLWLALRIADFTMTKEVKKKGVRYTCRSKRTHRLRWRLTPQWMLRWAYNVIYEAL